MVEVTFSAALINFIASMIVSSIIIYIVTKLFGEKEGLGTAIISAFIGSLIYALTYFFLGSSLFAAAIAGLVWLIALSSLYSMGWIKALGIAIVIWLLASFIGFYLPTVTGPL